MKTSCIYSILRMTTLLMSTFFIFGCFKQSQISTLEGGDMLVDDPHLGQQEEIRRLEFEQLSETEGHQAAVKGLYYSDNEGVSLLVSVDETGKVLAWSGDLSRAHTALEVPASFTASAFYSKSLLFAIAHSGKIEIYRLGDESPLYVQKEIRTRVSGLDFQPGGKSLLISGIDGNVYRWRFIHEQMAQSILEKEKSLQRYIGHGNVVSTVAWHPFGRIFFSGDWRGNLIAWRNYEIDLQSGEYDRNLFPGRMFSENATRMFSTVSTARIEAMKVDSKGEHVFMGLDNGSIIGWKVRGFLQVSGREKAHNGLIYDLAVSPSAGRVASVGRWGDLKIWKFLRIEDARDKSPGSAEQDISQTADDMVVEESLVRDIELTGVVPYVFREEKEVSLSRIRHVVFKSDDVLLAGTNEGNILEISLNED